ncbi:MAG: Mu-like prophage major head subunit gpT family protein [Campylobacterota bacterium]|nr:Mu-like prophage major head subunit gpT family protein [Campylobacterota bacterium]
MKPKIKKREALTGVSHTRKLTIQQTKRDDLEENTLSFVFVSSDNAGVRFNWDDYEYYDEVLDVSGANTERLNTFFKDHYRSVDSAIGKVSNVRVEDEQLVGDVTFGTDEDSQKIYRKYIDGILTDVSIGYQINKYDVDKRAENERDLVTVKDYSIFELSAVGIGFDAGAKKRENEQGEKMPENLLKRLKELEAMAQRNDEQNKELKNLVAQRDAEKVAFDTKEMQRLKDENLELTRKNDIEATISAYNPSKDLADKFRTAGTVNEFTRAILDERVKEQPNISTNAENENTRSSMINGMIDGLALRLGAKIEKPHKDAEKYRNAPLTQIGNILLPENERSFNPNEIAQRSLVSGDFPLLLQSVGARILTAEFEARLGTYKAWMKEVDVPDFRVMTELTASVGGGRLSKTLENGDLKELQGSEKSESWNIEPYGNTFVITRQMIINDDLGNFANLIAEFGNMAQTTANGIAYDLLQGKGDYASYKMADGSGLFVAARNNSATDALSPEALSAGRLAMSKHKGIDGKTPLTIVPKYLVVSPALEVQAREILGATNKIGADVNTGEINVHQGAYKLIVDAEITSDTAWYLLADRRTFKMGFLAGTGRKPVVKVNDSTLIRTTFEGVFDIGVMAEDYRGLYRGNV